MCESKCKVFCKFVFTLIDICWMTRGKSLNKGYWDQQRYIALQKNVSTGLVMAVQCYLLVLVLMVMSEMCMWRMQKGGEKVQRKMMFACAMLSSCFYFSYPLAHRKCTTACFQLHSLWYK